MERGTITDVTDTYWDPARAFVQGPDIRAIAVRCLTCSRYEIVPIHSALLKQQGNSFVADSRGWQVDPLCCRFCIGAEPRTADMPKRYPDTVHTLVTHMRDAKRHREAGQRVVYIGRANAFLGEQQHPLANPYVIKEGRTREAALKLYCAYINERPDLLKLAKSLRGYVLGCWCAPQPCHADIVAAIADNKVLE